MSESSSSTTSTSTTTNKATPVQGGGKTDTYSWTQEIGSVMVTIPVTPGTRAKQLNIVIKSRHLLVEIKGEKVLLDGDLPHDINTSESMWQLEDNREILVHLVKRVGTWWSSVLVGDPEVDTTKIEPPQAKLSELSGEVRSTVEKMLFDQNAKATGQPTSEERLREANIRRLKQMHPNVDWSKMDLSKAQFNF